METLLYLIKNWTSGKFSIYKFSSLLSGVFRATRDPHRNLYWGVKGFEPRAVTVAPLFLYSVAFGEDGSEISSALSLNCFFSFFIFIFPLLASLNLMDLSLTFICRLFLRCYSNAWYNWWISYLCTNMKYFCHKMCMKQFEVALTAFKMYNFE